MTLVISASTKTNIHIKDVLKARAFRRKYFMVSCEIENFPHIILRGKVFYLSCKSHSLTQWLFYYNCHKETWEEDKLYLSQFGQ